MKKRHIYRPAFYSFYDSQGIAAHLERMAARGWMIDSISGAFWRYRAIEPSQLHFSVTYFPKASSFDPGPTEGQQVFADYCAQVGWELAVRWGQMQIFYTDQSDPVPLETDPVTQVETIRAAMRRNFLPGMLDTMALAIFQLVFFFWRMYTGPLDARRPSGCPLPSWLCWSLVSMSGGCHGPGGQPRRAACSISAPGVMPAWPLWASCLLWRSCFC